MRIILISAVAFLFSGVLNAAPKGSGPVSVKCKDEIAKFCADKSHVMGEVRSCLEAKKDELSSACKEALESTGPGKGRGRGK